MKLSAFVAIAAVIGGSFLIAPSAAEARENCPSGTSYHKIKTGGLLIKRTIAEGCFTSFEAAQLRMQADGIEQNRRASVMRNINANKQRQCLLATRALTETQPMEMQPVIDSLSGSLKPYG